MLPRRLVSEWRREVTPRPAEAERPSLKAIDRLTLNETVDNKNRVREQRQKIPLLGAQADPHQVMLDRVFFALSDPIRRDILRRLGGEPLLVSEIADGYPISLQAVSRHVQVLVRAGLVSQARSGRISQCSLEVGPLYGAAVWINGYSRHWQAQFDALKAWLEKDAAGRQVRKGSKGKKPRVSKK